MPQRRLGFPLQGRFIFLYTDRFHFSREILVRREVEELQDSEGDPRGLETEGESSELIDARSNHSF